MIFVFYDSIVRDTSYLISFELSAPKSDLICMNNPSVLLTWAVPLAALILHNRADYGGLRTALQRGGILGLRRSSMSNLQVLSARAANPSRYIL